MTYSTSWEEVNKKDFIHDAEIMDATCLAERYRISRNSVLLMAKRYGITLKKKLGTLSVVKYKDTPISRLNTPDMTESCAYIYPNHQHLRIARV